MICVNDLEFPSCRVPACCTACTVHVAMLRNVLAECLDRALLAVLLTPCAPNRIAGSDLSQDRQGTAGVEYRPYLGVFDWKRKR